MPIAVPNDALRHAAGQIAQGGSTERTAQHLLDTFSAATVFSPAPPRPGVVALEFEGMSVVPVFSSRALLDDFTGGTDWFSTIGLDLLDLLPPGVRLALDPNGPHPLLIDPAAAKLEYAVIVRALEPSGDEPVSVDRRTQAPPERA